MTEILTVINERAADMPLLQAHGQRMGLPSLLDEHLPTHGHWQGLSLGWVATLWLTHLLSAGDHRLSSVEPGVQQRLWTLQRSTGPPGQALACPEDRVERVLPTLGADTRWEAVETALDRQGLISPKGGHVAKEISLRMPALWPP
jgi:hypothetical protein